MNRVYDFRDLVMKESERGGQKVQMDYESGESGIRSGTFLPEQKLKACLTGDNCVWGRSRSQSSGVREQTRGK